MRDKKSSKNRADTPSLKNYEDPLKTTSDRRGILGLLEGLLRSFRGPAFFILILPLVALYVISIALALSPGIYLALESANYIKTTEPTIVIQTFLYAISLASGILMYWITLILVVPIFNFPFLFWIRPIKGTWYSLQIIPWFYHNALTQLVRYSALEFLCPSPLSVLFYKLMGMKVGKGVVINSANISDPALITLEDYVTIGGSATLFAHYGMKGYLIVDKLIIKKGTTIGLKASLMGDVIVGENLTIPPHSVLLPKSRINCVEDIKE